jgi:hypothetical protein
LLQELLGQALRTLAHGIERAALAVDGAVRIALAERARGIAHRLVGVGEVVAALALLALALLPLLTLLALLPLLTLRALLVALLPEAALLHVLKQLFELLAQRLLALPQLAESVGIALLALLTLLTALPALTTLAPLLVRPACSPRWARHDWF